MKRAFAMHCVVGASNTAFDVLLKNAVIVFIVFRGGFDARMLSTVAALPWALFMAPFFIFSAHGGHLGDHFNKRKVALALRCADLVIAACAIYGFYTGNLIFLLVLVFAKGITATLYSPIKYSLVSEFLPPHAHGSGYALLEAVSMVAILSATYFGAMLGAEPETGKLGLLILLVVCVSFCATLYSPDLPRKGGIPASIDINPIGPILHILRLALRNRQTVAAILALSWFWALGAVYLSNVAVLVRDTLHGDESQTAHILVLFMSGLSLGLGSGAWLNRGFWARYLAYAMATLIAVIGIDLLYSIPLGQNRMLFDFFVLALAAGIYAAHFSALLYQTANEHEKSRIFAANNIISSLFIVLALATSALILYLQVSVTACLALFAAMTVPVTLLAGFIFRK